MTKTSKLGWLLVLVVLVFSSYYFYSSKKNGKATPVEQTVETKNQNWKTYSNSEFDFSVSYPPEFKIIERTLNNVFEFAIAASDNRSYLVVDVFTKPDLVSEEKRFAGPYPRTEPGGTESNPVTISRKTLNGMEGIESYGEGGGGEGFQYDFIYLDKYEWVVKLNPILEGKVTMSEEDAITSPEVAKSLSSVDKEVYQRILNSFKIISPH